MADSAFIQLRHHDVPIARIQMMTATIAIVVADMTPRLLPPEHG
jgi:hypothetical protein